LSLFNALTFNPDNIASNAGFAKALLNKLDFGLIILDLEYRVVLWNQFMVLHSQLKEDDIVGQTIFAHFPEIPEKWFKKKFNSAVLLKVNAFISWEQRTYLFRFSHNRPITGAAEYMAQNITFVPLKHNNSVSQVAIAIFDATDSYFLKNELQEANLELQRLSQTDGLTGLYNRSHLEYLLRAEFYKSQGNTNVASLIMLHVDHFKNINDAFGHLAGDAALRHLAKLLISCVQGSNFVGRYGGEEFVVALPNTHLDQALAHAEQIRILVSNTSFVHESNTIELKISLGVAMYNDQMNTYETWLNGADSALYVSKSSGRNKVTCYTQSV